MTSDDMYIIRYIVTYVEYGDSVDGKARVLGVYDNRPEATFEMHNFASDYYKDAGLDTIDILHTDEASVGDSEFGCELRIDRVKIPVAMKDLKREAPGKITASHDLEAEGKLTPLDLAEDVKTKGAGHDNGL